MYFLNNGESCKTHSSDFGVAEDQGGGANLDQNCFCSVKQKDKLPAIAGVKCAQVHRAVSCSLHDTQGQDLRLMSLLQSSWLLFSWLRWTELAGIFKLMGNVASPTNLVVVVPSSST